MKAHIDATTCMDSIWHHSVKLELDNAAASYAQRSRGRRGNQLARPNPSLSFTMLAKSFLYGCICVGFLLQTLLVKDTFLPSFCPAFQQFVKSCGSMLGSEKCLHRVCQVGILATALAIFVDKSSIIMLKGLAANSDHLKPSRGLLPS